MNRLVVVGLCSVSAVAHGGALDEVGSASDVTLNNDELKLRTHDGSTDLLRDLPGLFISQTAGGAVADLFTLRGFDGRAATDLSVLVDGVPVTMPSHPSGDGTADTHFLIAPTVTSLTLRKGPQPAHAFGVGNAGELSIRTMDVVPGNGVYIAARSGSMASDFTQVKQRLVRLMHRAVAMTSPTLTHGDAIIAAEVGITDGFSANPQRFRRSVLMAKWRHPTASGDVRLAANLYAGRWAESGLVPAADIEAGALGRFDSVDRSFDVFCGPNALRTPPLSSISIDVDTAAVTTPPSTPCQPSRITANSLSKPVRRPMLHRQVGCTNSHSGTCNA